MNITGSGTIEKDRRYPKTWKITFYLGEKDEKGRYKRAPKKTVHGSKADARKALNEYMEEYIAQMSGETSDSISAYADHFHEVNRHQLKSPLSIKREALDIEYVKKLFGSYNVTELTSRDIREVEAQARESGNWSSNQLHKMHIKLHQIMEQAFIDEIIDSNPVARVKMAKPAPEKERNAIAREDLIRLFKALSGRMDARSIGLLVIAATGIRRGEALGLTWKYVDFESEHFLTALQYDALHNLRPPKTQMSVRWICFKGRLASALKQWKEVQAEQLRALGLRQTEDTPVVHTIHHATEAERKKDPRLPAYWVVHIDPDNYRRWCQNFFVDNGFGKYTEDVRWVTVDGRRVQRGKKYRGLILHELRHTQSTIIQHDLNLKAAQHRLGHAQLDITGNTYTHFIDKDEIAAAETIDAIMEEAEGNQLSL